MQYDFSELKLKEGLLHVSKFGRENIRIYPPVVYPRLRSSYCLRDVANQGPDGVRDHFKPNKLVHSNYMFTRLEPST